MKCGKCGKEIQNSLDICPFCGEKVKKVSMPYKVGGQFVFGKYYSIEGKLDLELKWDVARVNPDSKMINVICDTIIDVKRYNDFEFDRNNLSTCDLYGYLNGEFFDKCIPEKMKKKLGYWSKEINGEKVKIGTVVNPSEKHVLGNSKTLICEFIKEPFKISQYALKKAEKLGIKYPDYYEFWLSSSDFIPDEMKVVRKNRQVYGKKVTLFSGVRPMISFSIDSAKALVNDKVIKYIKSADVLNNRLSEIREKISDIRSDDQRAYDWSYENLPGFDDKNWEPISNEEIKQKLIEQGYLEEYINKVL